MLSTLLIRKAQPFIHKRFKQIQLKWQFKLEHISDKSITPIGFNYKAVLIVTNTGFQHKARIRVKTHQEMLLFAETRKIYFRTYQCMA